MNDVVRDIIIHDESEFKRGVKFGNHVAVDKGVYATVNCNIGPYTHISPYVTIIGGEKGYFECRGFNNIMAGARIVCGSEFSNVGTNSIVLPGSRLRKGVLLTAGSLLIGDTEEWGVYKGNPAVLIKKIDGNKIIKNAKKLGYEF